MRFLISGGSGLVGRALVNELTAAGHRCEVLSRDPARATGVPGGTVVHEWNARIPDALVPLLDGVDAVVHLAGESLAAGRWTAARKRRIRDSRVVSTEALASALARVDAPPRVFLQASAVGYYGPRGDEEVTEESSQGSDFLAEVCRAWEAASEPIEALGVRRLLLRTGMVLSRQGGALPRMALPFRLFAGGPAGSGRQWVPWIHVGDEVGAIRFLFESGEARGAFNLVAPAPVTNREFGRSLARVLRRPSLVPAPAIALRLVLGEMADLVLLGQRAVPRRLMELGYRFRFGELPEALADLLG